MNDNSKKPAFPYSKICWNKDAEEYDSTEHSGLTKREYFASLAMQAILTANPAWPQGRNEHMPYAEAVAKYSIMYADEILKQLEK